MLCEVADDCLSGKSRRREISRDIFRRTRADQNPIRGEPRRRTRLDGVQAYGCSINVMREFGMILIIELNMGGQIM